MLPLRENPTELNVRSHVHPAVYMSRELPTGGPGQPAGFQYAAVASSATPTKAPPMPRARAPVPMRRYGAFRLLELLAACASATGAEQHPHSEDQGHHQEAPIPSQHFPTSLFNQF